MAYVQRRLEEAKIQLDVDVIRDMIEEAVLELAIKRDWGMTEDAPGDVFEGSDEPVEVEGLYKPPDVAMNE